MKGTHYVKLKNLLINLFSMLLNFDSKTWTTLTRISWGYPHFYIVYHNHTNSSNVKPLKADGQVIKLFKESSDPTLTLNHLQIKYHVIVYDLNL